MYFPVVNGSIVATESDQVITNVEMIENTGHHVYANKQNFNHQVNSACQSSDRIL